MNDREVSASEMAEAALLAAVPQFLHPAKVAIIEALVWMDEPLSPTQLQAVLEGPQWDLSLMSYHVKQLAEKGVLECVRREQVRGAVQTFYAISRPS
jgi:hypothetical protein